MRDFHLNTSPPLAVAIATAGRPLLLERTLDSLTECYKPVSYQGAWIVENGSPSGIRQLVAKYDVLHKFHYLHVPEANKSHALNALLSRVGNELLFFTDDDVRFERHVLSAYEEAATGVVEGQFYGGPLGVDYEGTAPPEWMKQLLPKTARGWRRDEDRITCLSRPRFLGPNWAAFAADLRRVGGFDPRLGPGSASDCTGDETDIQRRLQHAGVDGFYVPQAMAWHHVAAESLTNRWLVERMTRHGREWGIHRARRYPRGTIERYVRLRLGWARLAAHVSLDNERSRLRVEHEIARWQGRLEGLAIGRQWHALPPIEPILAGRQVAA